MKYIKKEVMMKVLNRKLKGLLKKLYLKVVLPLIKDALEENNDVLLHKTARLINIAQLHQQTFSKYKGCNKGKSVVIVGAGPSLNNFKPIDDCVYVGVNSAIMFSKVKFDYLFTIDKLGINNVSNEYINYDCVKFIGDQHFGPQWQIPESLIQKMKGEVLRYKTDTALYRESSFTLDIESEPLGNFSTIALQALQFVLYTNPQKIYLVGMDCTSLGHFGVHDSVAEHKKNLADRGESLDDWAKLTLNTWQSAKNFADQYYPDTEIISVNPVGLRGLFTDIDQ